MNTQTRADGFQSNHRRPLYQGNDTLMRVNGQPERWLVAARLSKMSKRDRDRGDELITGIQTQDKRAAEWAQHEGHVIVHVTRDKNVSGAVAPWERPELGPWLTDPVKLVQYDGIVAYCVDRLSREYFDTAWLRKWAETHRKKLYVIKERLRWPDDRDGAGWAWAAERAHQERLDITERVGREITELRRAGKLVSKAPFGYRVDGEKYDKRLVPTEIGRKYIPLIFRHVIDGWSVIRIAAWLNAEGVPRESSLWYANSTGLIIRNPVYKGHQCAHEIIPPDEVEVMADGEVTRCRFAQEDDKIVRYRYGDKWVETPRWRFGKTIHRCEPLVDATTWQRANEALSSRTPRGHIAMDCAMLAGALYCPNCQDTSSPMYRIRSGAARNKAKGQEYLYYRCTGRGAMRVSCRNLVKVELVDAAVNGIITRRFNTPVMEHRIIYGNEAEVANRLEEIRFELKQLAAKSLPWAEEDAERAVLRAEYDRVAATTIVEDRVELMPTGETYRQIWERLALQERGRWLAENGFRVFASKTEVRVVKDDDYVAVAL